MKDSELVLLQAAMLGCETLLNQFFYSGHDPLSFLAKPQCCKCVTFRSSTCQCEQSVPTERTKKAHILTGCLNLMLRSMLEKFTKIKRYNNTILKQVFGALNIKFRSIS